MPIPRTDGVAARRTMIAPPTPMPDWLWRRISRITGLDHLESLYRQLPPDLVAADFAAAALDKLGVTWSVDPAEILRLPSSAGLVVAANHPYGGIDGLAAIAGIAARRPDLKVLATQALASIPALRSLLIPVDNFGRADSRAGNVRAVRAALRHVREGGALLLFPAGEVAHLDLSSRRVIDPPWKRSAVAMIIAAGADVVPLYVHGSNSIGFQLAGLLHPSLRTALLPREVLNKRGTRLDLRFGTPIPQLRLRACGDPERVEQLLKIRLYSLAAPRAACSKRTSPRGASHWRVEERSKGAQEPIAPPADAVVIGAEVDALGAESTLCRLGAIDVLLARGANVPRLLHEVGRLRETTFRAVGEGTGQSLDIDRFDRFYEHLIAWDSRQRRVIGGYRLARVDEVRRRYGRSALYLAGLFEFREPFFPLLGPALELGRSFIRPEYQRSYAPLLALWRGIGEYVARNPRYSKLIGPVSVSADYDATSRDLLVRYLRWHHFDPVLGALVRPRSPYEAQASLAALRRDLLAVRDIEELSPLMSATGDGHGERSAAVPVLLRQYLKLGGRVLGFNVDAGFGHCLDCLTVVDLCRTPDRVLAKYMDERGLANFRRHHANGMLRKP
ncbi:MAG: GNAT family N-acetyltransferase [Gammaproteobacteria bacterium]|nr:GNAT family N-acetyltransferase [Gammaproteobacteria bacterium]